MMKNILLLTTLFYLSVVNITAKTTTIPDVNFEQALINLGCDTGTPNGIVLTASIDTVTVLNIFTANISSLIGIENFTALTELRYSNNAITSLDISQNTALTILSCTNNQLTTLDVTPHLNLIDLSCDDNTLSVLDLTQNAALKYLSCGQTLISNLDVSQNPNLIALFCGSIPNLTNLDVSQNTSLKSLSCNLNPELESLNVKNGNNSNFTYFSTIVSPKLKCIFVDDKNATHLSTWIKSSTSHFVNDTLDCQNITSLNEYKIDAPLNIYPNPAVNYAVFEFEKTPVQLVIYDIQNRIVLDQTINEKTFKMVTNTLKKGLYFCNAFYREKLTII
jgi:hypothetical protein